MKSFTHYLTLNIPSKIAVMNIPPEVEEAVKVSGVKEGIALLWFASRGDRDRMTAESEEAGQVISLLCRPDFPPDPLQISLQGETGTFFTR